MRRLLPAFALLLILGGCASAPPGPQREAGYGSFEISEVPFYPQREFQCGPAALAMVLEWSGIAADPDALARKIYIPEREGSLQPEIRAQARRHGRLVYQIRPNADALLTELEAGNPVIVLQNLGLNWMPIWHYAVAIGYDDADGTMVLRSGETERHTVGLNTFLRTWARGGNWGLLVLPAGRVPATAEQSPYLAAAFDLERSGQPEAAEAAYRAGLRRWPGQAQLSLALANMEYARGETAAAIETLRAAVTAGSENGAVYNNLALLLAELGQWEEAEANARRAVALGGRYADEFEDTLRRIRCRMDSSCAHRS